MLMEDICQPLISQWCISQIITMFQPWALHGKSKSLPLKNPYETEDLFVSSSTTERQKYQ